MRLLAIFTFVTIYTSQLYATGVPYNQFYFEKKPEGGDWHSGDVRNYWLPVSEEDYSDVSFIVTTMADKPLGKLLFYRGSLIYTGEKVNHLHPLKFLTIIFADEENKVAVRNVRKRGWVWNEFMNGVCAGLDDELGRSNLTAEQLDDFAEAVGVKRNLLDTPVQKKDWYGLVDVLIDEIPRQDGHDKYDM